MEYLVKQTRLILDEISLVLRQEYHCQTCFMSMRIYNESALQERPSVSAVVFLNRRRIFGWTILCPLKLISFSSQNIRCFNVFCNKCWKNHEDSSCRIWLMALEATTPSSDFTCIYTPYSEYICVSPIEINKTIV